MSILVVATNGFSGTGVLMLVLSGAMALLLYATGARARKRAACRFDHDGVTLGDRRRLDWTDFRGVRYLMALERGGAEESLWRVELAFTGGVAWIIPLRVKNLEEINDLVVSLPGPHQTCRA